MGSRSGRRRPDRAHRAGRRFAGRGAAGDGRGAERVARHRPPAGAPGLRAAKRRLTWANGATPTLYSAGEPESLRGPQHSHAWCDEIAKWGQSHGRAEAAWDNLLLGLRLGDRPQVVATTTTRAVTLLRRLLAQPDVVVTRGRTEDNEDMGMSRYLQWVADGYTLHHLLYPPSLSRGLVRVSPRGAPRVSREPGGAASGADRRRRGRQRAA